MNACGRTMILVAVILCSGFAYSEDASQTKPAATWEYKILLKADVYTTINNAHNKKTHDAVTTTTTVETILNDLGAKGWELVSVDDTSYIFKRPGKKLDVTK